MFDHVAFAVTDFPAVKAFYIAALAPVGIGVAADYGDTIGIGRDGRPQLFFRKADKGVGRLHIAFTAKNRSEVRAFHEAALKAGGTDNGAPGLRLNYHPNYYGAFVIDPNGHNIEVVCHSPEA
jgi:catechol 2,3-dioxygenase-like lactoylglutathione lyase family enzyme